ncbi:MAG: uracil-DNA glycosylase [Armatimonadota bacterium]|nr:uracil-DNA glycosylase [Armatimonadota bacterium]
MQTKPVNKSGEMKELRNRAESFAALSCEPGSTLVWGEGALDAKIAFVGEAPGDYETRLGRPFVGPAGQLFNRELERAGIDRAEVWISNVVKCRPITISPSGRAVNRAPTRNEVAGWLPYLLEELKIIGPHIIVCLGAIAAMALISRDFAITKQRGQWFDGPLGAKIMATFHPSYILRVTAADGEEQQEAFRTDLAEVKKLSAVS